jgi:hypothetical protein
MSMNAEQDRRIEACVRFGMLAGVLGVRKGAKYCLFASCVCAMKSCQAEHRSRNGVFEFHSFRSSVR